MTRLWWVAALAVVLAATAPAAAQSSVDDVLDDQRDRVADARDLARDVADLDVGATEGGDLFTDDLDDDGPLGDGGAFGDSDDDLFVNILTGDEGAFGDAFGGSDGLIDSDAFDGLDGFDGFDGVDGFDAFGSDVDDDRLALLLVEAARRNDPGFEDRVIRALALNEDLSEEDVAQLQDINEEDLDLLRELLD